MGVLLNTGKVAIKGNVFHDVDQVTDIRKRQQNILVEKNYSCTNERKSAMVNIEVPLSKWYPKNSGAQNKKIAFPL
ncbi:MAG: hypothetical protein AAF985_22540 [Bacteroidota bacterium]